MYLLTSVATVIDIAENKTLPASTVFQASTTVVQTRTIIPRRVTKTTTKVIATVTKGRPSVQIVKTTKIETPSCTVPPRQPTRDPQLHFRPKFDVPHAAEILAILREAAPAVADAPISPPRVAAGLPVVGSGNFRTWNLNGRSIKIDKENFLRERSERLGYGHLDKRAPDEPVVTVNATDTAAYPT